MCNVLCECVKCPGRVICCCFNCALRVLLTIICSLIIVVVAIALIVYFCVFYHKDGNPPDDVSLRVTRSLAQDATQHFRDLFKPLQ